MHESYRQTNKQYVHLVATLTLHLLIHDRVINVWR